MPRLIAGVQAFAAQHHRSDYVPFEAERGGFSTVRNDNWNIDGAILVDNGAFRLNVDPCSLISAGSIDAGIEGGATLSYTLRHARSALLHRIVHFFRQLVYVSNSLPGLVRSNRAVMLSVKEGLLSKVQLFLHGGQLGMSGNGIPYRRSSNYERTPYGQFGWKRDLLPSCYERVWVTHFLPVLLGICIGFGLMMIIVLFSPWWAGLTSPA